jgi:hypothetical protein
MSAYRKLGEILVGYNESMDRDMARRQINMCIINMRSHLTLRQLALMRAAKKYV